MVIRLTTLNNSTLRSRSSSTSPNLYILASPISLFHLCFRLFGVVRLPPLSVSWCKDIE